MRICRNEPFRLHFAGSPAKGKRISQNQLAASRFFKNFRLSSYRQLISGLIFDQRHVNALHDALAESPALFVAKRNAVSGQWRIVLERSQARARRGFHFGLRHFSAIESSPSPSGAVRAAWTRKTFRICRTQIPVRICTDGPFRPHFASAQAKGKRSSQKRLAESRFFEKPQCLQTRNSLGKRTSSPVRPVRAAADSQNFWRLENVRTLFRRSN